MGSPDISSLNVSSKTECSSLYCTCSLDNMAEFDQKKLKQPYRYPKSLDTREPRIIQKAKSRIEDRLGKKQFGMVPKIQQFMETNLLFSSGYVINGISKRDFAARLINHQVLFCSHLKSGFNVQQRLCEIGSSFPSALLSEKKQLLEEMCSVFSLGTLSVLMEQQWKPCCHLISCALNDSFKSNDSVLVEHAAIATALMAVRFPIETFRDSAISSNILKPMLHAFKICYLAIMNFTKNLQKARFSYLDDKIRGKETRFCFSKFKSTITNANHRLGSIIYYTLSLVLHKINSAQHLYVVAVFALMSRNPVQYFLLKLLERGLQLFDAKISSRSSKHQKKFFCQMIELMKRFEESEGYESVNLPCKILVSDCLKLAFQNKKAKYVDVDSDEKLKFDLLSSPSSQWIDNLSLPHGSESSFEASMSAGDSCFLPSPSSSTAS